MEPKQDLFRFCFGLFRETKNKNISVCFGVSNLYRNNRNKQNCFETNQKDFQQNTYSYSLGCTLVGRHFQVRHKALVDRHAQVQQKFLQTGTSRYSTKLLSADIQVQRKALLDRPLYVEHKALVDRHARCSTKVLENTKKTRPGAVQALAEAVQMQHMLL